MSASTTAEQHTQLTHHHNNAPQPSAWATSARRRLVRGPPAAQRSQTRPRHETHLLLHDYVSSTSELRQGYAIIRLRVASSLGLFACSASVPSRPIFPLHSRDSTVASLLPRLFLCNPTLCFPFSVWQRHVSQPRAIEMGAWNVRHLPSLLLLLLPPFAYRPLVL